jgi:ATP-dependent exoDNAse (exonuclease V) beta subunit
MSTRDDAIAGAVSYTPSSASVEPGEGGGVRVHALFDGVGDGGSEGEDARVREAHRVAALIASARADDPRASVALLVRTRAHLQAILPRLREHGIRYRGVDIEPLAEVPVVEDLMALTRALLHPVDRVAWLALLRAPWCGLTLADLYALAGNDHDTPILDLLAGIGAGAGLSADGRLRAERLRAVLDSAVGERGRRPLRRWVEGTWAALGGPACVDTGELANARAFLELLDGFDASGAAVDGDELARRAARLYAVTEVEDADVEIMTIHKAKGLEFDVVIVPSLDRGARADDRRLLAWTKRAGESEDSNILLAPVPSPSEDAPPIYDYLRSLEAEKDVHEQARLLYVAATRARKALHLIGTVSVKDGATLVAPDKSSLLRRLWPAVQGAFEEAFATTAASPATDARGAARVPAHVLRRLPAGWRTPPPPSAVESRGERPEPPADRSALAVEFDWAGETARHVGTVVHRALMEISRDGADAWDAARLERRRPAWRAMLAGLGIPERELAGSLQRVDDALAKVVADARGRWLLDTSHAHARSEFALTGVDGDALVNVVIDRSFVDADGVRWIVDYKSGRHEGGDMQAFLDREQQRYREQLQRYARLMSTLESRPIRLGLYFPALGGWREWPFEPA